MQGLHSESPTFLFLYAVVPLNQCGSQTVSSHADSSLSFQPTHYQIPSLYCSYETSASPYLLLQPVRKEVIHLEPYVVLYHDFVSDLEAQKIRGFAEPWVSVPHTCQELLLRPYTPGVQEYAHRRPAQRGVLSVGLGVQNDNHSMELINGEKNHSSGCLWREGTGWEKVQGGLLGC